MTILWSFLYGWWRTRTRGQNLAFSEKSRDAACHVHGQESCIADYGVMFNVLRRRTARAAVHEVDMIPAKDISSRFTTFDLRSSTFIRQWHCADMYEEGMNWFLSASCCDNLPKDSSKLVIVVSPIRSVGQGDLGLGRSQLGLDYHSQVFKGAEFQCVDSNSMGSVCGLGKPTYARCLHWCNAYKDTLLGTF